MRIFKVVEKLGQGVHVKIQTGILVLFLGLKFGQNPIFGGCRKLKLFSFRLRKISAIVLGFIKIQSYFYVFFLRGGGGGGLSKFKMLITFLKS